MLRNQKKEGPQSQSQITLRHELIYQNRRIIKLRIYQLTELASQRYNPGRQAGIFHENLRRREWENLVEHMLEGR